MLRNVDDWDGQHFAFHPDGAAPGATGIMTSGHEGSAPTVTVPDAHFLFNADFRRAGPDLVLTGDDGRTVVIHDYFATEHRATLLSREGMAIAPHVVEALAGPLAPGQYAQAAGAQPAAQAVGRVAKVDGDVTVVRNGVAITVKVGDPILRGDVLQTRSGQLGVTFNDGSTINLTENARLVVNEFIYDPKGNANSQILDLVQGSLTFISGEIAHSGDMKIGTPVATMGIRGTMGGVTGAESDQVSFFIVQSDRGAVLTDSNGTVIAQVVQNGPLIVVRPVGPLQVLAEEVQKSPAQLATELAALQHIVSVQSVGQQIIQQFFNPNQNNPQSNGTDHTQIQIEIPKSAILPDNAGGGGDGNTNTAGNNATVTVITGNNDTNPNPPQPPEQFTVELPVNLPPIIFTPFASAFVSEEGLATGIADGAGSADTTNAVVAQGTIDAGDGNGDQLTFTLGAPILPLTSNDVPITWQGAGTSTLVGKAGGATIVTITIGAHTGAYTVTLAGPVDHLNAIQEDIKVFNVPVSVTDGSTTKTASLAVTIEDDSPVAPDYVKTISTAGQSFSLAFVLDFSGSISDEQLNEMLEEVKAVGQAVFAGTDGVVAITVVAFASSAITLGTYDNFSDFQDAINDVAPNSGTRPTNIGNLTDYTDAIQQTMISYAAVDGSNNQVFFLSDGIPNEQTGTDGNSLDDETAIAWLNFVNNNDISITTVGIGAGANTERLQDVDVDGGSPITVDGFDNLVESLLSAVVYSQSGNVLSDGNANVGLGSDGGRILSIAVDGVTYTRDEAGTITASGPGAIGPNSISVETTTGGHFEFYFANSGGHQAGDWSYSQAGQSGQPIEDIFHYVLIDNDGDTSGGDIAFNLPPVINALSLDATDECNSNDTMVTGIEILDVDAGDGLLKLTATIDSGTLTFLGQQLSSLTGNGTNDLSALDTLANINAAFTSGFVYSPTPDDPQDPNSLPASDKITLTVEDNHGASDSLTFVFNVPDQPVGDVDLTGTPGKDYIFATGQNNTLTGDGGSDTYVFAAGDIGGNDLITDFSLLDDFLVFEQSVFANVNAVLTAAIDDGQGNTLITDNANVMITLHGIDVSQFQNTGHGHILIV